MTGHHDRKAVYPVRCIVSPFRIDPEHRVRQMYGWVSRHQQMADIADIWIYIIDKVFRGRLIRMGTRKNAIAIKQEPTVLFIFNLFIIILYEYVCSLIRLVHRYLSGSSIRMLLQIDTIEFKNVGASSNSIFVCRCFNSSQIPLYQEGDFNMALNQWKGTGRFSTLSTITSVALR